MLLICIALKSPEDYARNQDIYEKLFEQREAIEVADHSIIFSNIDSISLKIGSQFLYTSMKKDIYSEILELMPHIQKDVAITIAVTQLIVDYLETNESVMLPKGVEAIVLQSVLQRLLDISRKFCPEPPVPWYNRNRLSR